MRRQWDATTTACAVILAGLAMVIILAAWTALS